jgi:hypothetical protein
MVRTSEVPQNQKAEYRKQTAEKAKPRWFEQPKLRTSAKTGDEKPETYMGTDPSPHRKALYLSNV